MLASTSPGSPTEECFPLVDFKPLTKLDSRVGGDSHQGLIVRTPPAGRLMTNTGQCHTSEVGITDTHDRARVAIAGDFRSFVSSCTVVDEDLSIGTNTS